VQDSLESMILQKESKLRRNSAELHAERKCASGPSVWKDQRSRPLTLRNSSKLGGSVSSGGGETMVVGSNTVKNLDH
jgi:hypothetical protein